MEPIKARVGELLRAGAECEQPKTRRTCENLLKHEVSLWTFVREPNVEPTNNDAERPLRRAVLWRRKSFGTQSEKGSRFVEWILTAVTTLRQQGRDVLDYLTVACTSVVLMVGMGTKVQPRMIELSSRQAPQRFPPDGANN